MITESLETTRLLIRPFREDDWQDVAAYTTMPSVMEYIGDGVDTLEQARAWVRKNATGEDVRAYALVLKTDNHLIGHMVFHPWFAPQTYEIGWVLHPDFHRRGYASEAALVLLRFGFAEMKLHRIIATCQPENMGSWGVMEKIGMRREGHFQQCIHRGGDKWWDEYFYAMLRDEWQERQSSCS